MRVGLLIVIDNGAGKALAVAQVRDVGLLTAAANAAINEKRAEADHLAEDAVLRVVVGEEVRRLERTLSELIPGCTAPAAVM